MFYNGLIFDLDGTLYNYDKCHETALRDVLEFLVSLSNNLSYNLIHDIYSSISAKLKNELGLTASAHNKSIYFKHLLENLNVSYTLLPELNSLYWHSFYQTMKCYEGVKEFMRWNKTLGKKIGILTDYETEYQIIKLKQLGLVEYIDVIVTSEEVGIEKPSEQMFQTILRKMNLHASEVIMLGDNYEKDIRGARQLNIFSYWFNPVGHYEKGIGEEFNDFTALHLKFKEIYAELATFERLSKYCGERFDLVQAGGGNSSVKIDDWLFIKASGYSLSAIDLNNGYVMLDNKKIKKDIATETIAANIVNYNVLGTKRASIETYMHSILKKYTIHLHPIQLNRLLIAKNAREMCQNLYPAGLIVDYLTPGIKVCNEIKRTYNNKKVIFLINHGLIITSDEIEEINTLLEDVLLRFETMYPAMNFDKYKNTNRISRVVNTVFGINNVSYLCEDSVINNYVSKNSALLEENITFPDALIYCGIRILSVDDFLRLETDLALYKTKYEEPPKIIVLGKHLYITSHTLNKCKETEEVLKANLMILDNGLEKTYLSMDEICFLNKWDAEKYRKLL
jgi:FMN phosphatase YigB (HAD superfamily)/ribulose-5-phosphate 4-epimerase/fuculose-1-phosphate aldolase